MIRPTLSTFRRQWPAEAMGVCQADTAVANYANDAQDRLLMDPLCPDEGWWGGWVTMQFAPSVVDRAAYVITPREICRLADIAVCQNPIPLRNGFYEYLQFGAGLQPKNCHNSTCGATFAGYDRDNVCTLNQLVGTKTIRVYLSDTRDVGRRVLLQGKDQNGLTILTTDPGTGHSAAGEYLALKSPFVDSVNTYSSVTGIQKDETFGPVQFFQVDPTTGGEGALTIMEPNEASGSYRRYLITGIPNINACCGSPGTLQVTAQAKLDFIPVVNETDYLTVPNVPALLEEAQSIRFNRMDSTSGAQQAALHHQRALALLFGQLDKHLGKISTAVKVPLFGSNRLRPSFM